MKYVVLLGGVFVSVLSTPGFLLGLLWSAQRAGFDAGWNASICFARRFIREWPRRDR